MTRIIRALTLALVACATDGAFAQAYPSKPIQFVINYPPGAATDIFGRIMAEQLAKRLNQSIVVDNRAGAGGVIGAEFVKRAPADGYTLLFANDNMPLLQALTPDKTVNIVSDFVPVVLAGTVDFFLVVSGEALAAKDAQQLVRMAKAKPGSLSYASSGIGAPQHLGMELFKQQTSTDIVHVPYKGMGQGVVDMLGGRIQVAITGFPAVGQYLGAGKIRILASSGVKRSPLQPEAPTLSEAGIPNVEVEGFLYLVAPLGTPAAIVARLNAEANQILAAPDVKATLAKQAINPTGGTPEVLHAKLAGDVAKWTTVIRKAGIKAE
jgi:tripartite-type tricarboxylate transporter receptor subunit TctC